MIPWHTIPFARMVIPIVSGIVLAYCIPISIPSLLIGITIVIASFILLERIDFLQASLSRKLKSILVTIIGLAIGALALTLQYRSKPKNHFSLLKGDYLIVQIKEINSQEAKKLVLIAEVKNVLNGEQIYASAGKLYLQIKTNHPFVQPNDHIIIKNACKALRERKYPWEFDFKSYLRLKGIHHQQSIFDQSFKHIRNHSFSIQKLAYNLKLYCLKNITTFIKDKSIAGLSAGLTLGYKADLDADMTRYFSNSGTLHLLASSGLHVGLIYLVLNFLSLPIKKIKHGDWIQMITINILLWIYALMTGLGPSIVRATVLFNLSGIGQILGRKKQALNLLFATACIQLIIDPLALFQIGFQLSYAAVLGILTLHPFINSLWQTENKFLKYIKEMSSVSLSAQLFTLPITLYYFGSFPLLFLIANLLLIPLCTILLYSVLALLALSWIKPLATLLTLTINKLSQLIFFLSSYLGTIKGTVNHILFPMNATIALGCAIILLTLACLFRSKAWLISGATSLLFMVVLQKIASFDKSREQALIFNINNYQTIVCIKGYKAWVLFDKERQKNNKNIIFLLHSLNLTKELKEIQEIDLNKLFVSTNLYLYPGLGLQFFDKTMTLK